MTKKITGGVLSPVVTPFDADLRPDRARWLAHCRWLLSQDCGLAIFGTNSEANSLSLAERRALLEAAAQELDPGRMMPGTGASALPDAVELTRAAVEAGCAGVLMLPPFYYKGVTDDGLFAFYSEIIQRIGDDRLRIYLYHIPPVSQVPISLDLIERLLSAYPGTIAGVKDSSGDWSNTAAMIERFDNFDVFAGSEEFLLPTLRAGGAGCISATANINPAAIHDVFVNWRAPDADARQEAITAFRREIAKFPMIPALKAVIGLRTDDPDWGRVRPPLMRLDEAALAELSRVIDQADFQMPGRREAA
ncbi:dihydrodipicolinate synthase family protein [Pikeienuella sp. HZG-20]|uniref:dihydrodipicolinate synthase family protein n=1 Tax=Paludibacillus litoralis TaxID=3133267 RepID=UPI0030EB17C1